MAGETEMIRLMPGSSHYTTDVQKTAFKFPLWLAFSNLPIP